MLAFAGNLFSSTFDKVNSLLKLFFKILGILYYVQKTQNPFVEVSFFVTVHKVISISALHTATYRYIDMSMSRENDFVRPN